MATRVTKSKASVVTRELFRCDLMDSTCTRTINFQVESKFDAIIKSNFHCLYILLPPGSEINYCGNVAAAAE